MHGTAKQVHIGLACAAVTLTACGSRSLDLATYARDVADAPTRAVERGRYLSMVGGCNDCHTPGGMFGAPDGQRALSGSELGWRGPWGVTYPRNLTPDVETGIGTWSATQIVNAIRTGRRPDGTTLGPPMPWPNYAGMSDADAYSIAAYLQSLPKVRHPAPRALTPDAPLPPIAAVVSFPAPPAWDAPRTPSAIGGGPPPIRVEVDGSTRGYPAER